MTTAPEPPVVEDPDNYEEPADYTLRRQLGLRPIFFPADGRAPHPDQGPCPTWCWLGHSDSAHHHEVDPDCPATPRHTMEASPSILASQYKGTWLPGSDRGVGTATIEPHLEQDGQSPPIIALSLRVGGMPPGQGYAELLRLGMTDARELVTVLNYLIETAES